MVEQLTAETPVPQPLPPEVPTELDPTRFNLYVERFKSDSMALPRLFENAGIPLDHQFKETLLGSGQVDDGRIAGFARASALVGEVINRTSGKHKIVNIDKLPVTEVMAEDGGIDYVTEWPSEAQLQALIESRSAGEMGALLARMAADTIHPYAKQDGDGYIELNPRNPQEAYKVGRYEFSEGETAKLCSNAENFFARYGFGPKHHLEQITVNGEVVALKKKEGEHTAVLVKPAILNGVRIPEGSIMMVDTESDQPRFAFGRLSLFNFTTAQEAARQMPNIVIAEFSETFDDLQAAMNQFNSLVGRTVTYPEDHVQELLEKFGVLEAFGWDAEEGQVEKTLTQAAAYNRSLIEDDLPLRKVAALIDRQNHKAEEAALAKWHDKQVERESDWKIDPHTRDEPVKRLAQMKGRMYQIFGPEAVQRVRFLLDTQHILEHMQGREAA